MRIHSFRHEATLAVLTDLVDKIVPKKLLKLVTQSNEITWAQRLGYLLESINAKKISDELEKKIRTRNKHIRILAPTQSRKAIYNVNYFTPPALKNLNKSTAKRKINKKWKLIINKKLEPDT